MKASTLLVTGAAGFIGFHTAKRLLGQGHQVVGVDNVNSYYAQTLKRARLEVLSTYPGFLFAEEDMCDLSAMERLFVKHKPSIVCNLAAQAGVRHSLIDPFVYQRSNVEGFLNMIELSKRHGVTRFVYASSSSVYGGLSDPVFFESSRVDTPISLYAATKKADELIAHSYTHLFGLPTVGLRFFSVYGPWGRPDMALWIFTESILDGKPIELYNFGNMKRDFTYIDDIVSGVVAALFVPTLPPYSIINLGNNRPEELMDMISILEHELGRSSVKKLLPMQPGDIPSSCADISLAQKMLGFQPSVTLEAGMKSFIQWYREHPEIIESVKAARWGG